MALTLKALQCMFCVHKMPDLVLRGYPDIFLLLMVRWCSQQRKFSGEWQQRGQDRGCLYMMERLRECDAAIEDMQKKQED